MTTRAGGRLTVCGHGFKQEHLTLEALDALKRATKIFYGGWPSKFLEKWFPKAQPEDALDMQLNGKGRMHRYEDMVERVLAAVRQGHNVCVAIYGSAANCVWPTHRMISRARQEGYEAKMLPGISATEAMCCDLGVDPVGGEFARPRWGMQTATADTYLRELYRFHPHTALVLYQLHSIDVPSDDFGDSKDGIAKLTEHLTKVYGEYHEVTIYSAAMSAESRTIVKTTSVFRLPEVTGVNWGNVILYVPPVTENMSAFLRGVRYGQRRALEESAKALALQERLEVQDGLRTKLLASTALPTKLLTSSTSGVANS